MLKIVCFGTDLFHNYEHNRNSIRDVGLQVIGKVSWNNCREIEGRKLDGPY